MEKLLRRMSSSLKFAEDAGENMDEVSWGMQEGILISYNEAKVIIDAINKNKDTENACTHENTAFKRIRCDVCSDCGEIVQYDI